MASSENPDSESAIEIQMLGGFSIRRGDRVIAWETGRARQPWILLEYLIANRQTAVSPEKLYDVLWEDGESENPANALKNLIYRLRGLLSGLCGGGSCEFVVYRHGRYSWNNALPCTVDSEELERAFRAARQSGVSDDGRIRLYRKAVELYRGEFLAGTESADWIVRIAVHYQSVYAACVTDLATLLLLRGEYREAVFLCERAVEIDPFQESVHEMLIRAYLMAGERTRAMDHYRYIAGSIVEKLGVNLTDGFRRRVDRLLQQTGSRENDLDDIAGELQESTAGAAYYCDYGVFRELCRLELRLAERQGKNVFLSLLTVRTAAGAASGPSLRETMADLLNILLHSLRKGDTVSRVNASQFILMLVVPGPAQAKTVVQRIAGTFAGMRSHRGMRLITRLRRLTPPLDRDRR